MASTGLQLVGFVLGVLSWIGMIGTCSSPEWKKNSHGQTLIDSTLRYDGLWVRCKAFPTGLTNCDDYKAFFIGLPVVLQICRALMISAIGLGFIAIIVTVLGIKCTSIGGSHPRTKAKVTMIGGLLFGVAAILIGASVSYYAHGVVQEYYNPALREDRPMHLIFEYGSALFVGWASLVVGLLGGVILVFTSVFIIMRLNMAKQRGRHKAGKQLRGGFTPQELQAIQQQANQQRTGNLQISKQQQQQQQQRGQGRQMIDDMNQRTTIHSTHFGSKNGHSYTMPHPASTKVKKYENERPQRPSYHLDPSGHHHHHHHHHHGDHKPHGSKTNSTIPRTRPQEDEVQQQQRQATNMRTRSETGRDDSNGYHRPRPVKEYV